MTHYNWARHINSNELCQLLWYISITVCVTMMSQEKGLDQRKSDQFCNFDDMTHKTADLFHWS